MPRYASLPVPKDYVIIETAEGLWLAGVHTIIDDRDYMVTLRPEPYKRRFSAVQACYKHKATLERDELKGESNATQHGNE